MIEARPYDAQVRGPDATTRPVPHREGALIALVTCVLLISLLFGLPHLLIPRLLGDAQPYTPLPVSGVSALTYDETSSYASYVNYVLRRAAPPYDTDVFENRDIPVPTSVAPYFALAALAAVIGGVEQAFIVADFLLPAGALVVVYVLLHSLTRSRGLALLGALSIVLVPFGPRNLLGVPWSLLTGNASDVVQPLEYSRLMHPQFSFTLFAIALLCLWWTLRTGSLVAAVVAGLFGALQFYTYVYYWPVWIGACLLLAVVWSRVDRRVGPAMYVTNAVTWLVSIPFWITLLDATRHTNMTSVVVRHMSETSHVPPPQKLVYTGICCLLFIAFVTFYWGAGDRIVNDRLASKRVLAFFSSIFIASIAAFNMEVVTGFNLEAMLHYTNRLLQPLIALSALVLVLGPIARAPRAFRLGFVERHARALVAVPIAVLLSVAAVRQVVVSANVAEAHGFTDRHRLILSWLNANTRLDDVVLSTDRDTNDLLPAFTGNRAFVPNGVRTSATNAEITRRFLIAMKLLGRGEQDVRALLSQDVHHGEPPIGLTYTYFLFLGIGEWRLSDAEIDRLLVQFRALDLSAELGRQRLDYVYGRGAEQRVDVPGWTFSEVYSDEYGRLWRVSR